jgi:hypothetical protein
VNLAPNGTNANYSTYLGGESSPTSYSPIVAMDGSGNVYFASNIAGPDAPVSLPTVQNPGEGFLAKISSAAAPAVIAIPSQVVFNSVQVVHSTGTMTNALELRNVGSVAAAVTKPFVFNSTEFSETDNCPASLPAGGICNVNLNFTPASSGQRTGTLKVPSTAAISPAIVSISGVGADGYNAVVTPTSIAFGDVVLNTPTAAASVTVRNTGDQPMGIISVTPTLQDYVATSTCPGQLAAGASCQLNVTFKPSQIGFRSGSFLIQLPGFYYYNGYAYPNELVVTVTGTGVTAASGTGTLGFSETGVNFGNVVVGATPSIESVSLVNTGSAPVTINSLTVTTNANPGNPGDFKLAGPPQNYAYGYCGSTYAGVYSLPFALAPQSSCVLLFQFTPSIAGPEAATLSVSDSAIRSPHSLGLSGIGLHTVQALTVNPAKITFPAQPLGVAGAPQSFYVTNSSEDFVVIDRAVTTGDFVVDDVVTTNNCEGTVLAPQGSCVLEVAFRPTVLGARAGTLSMIDTNSGTPQVFNLAGTGVQATGSLVAGQTSITFPQQAQGTTSPAQEVVFSNSGNSAVNINTLVASGDFAVVTPPTYSYPQPCGGTLAPASVCQTSVVYSPTQSSGHETGTLTAHSTAGNVVIQLAGTAYSGPQSIAVAPTAVNFGSSLVGSTYSYQGQVNVYLVNTGIEPVTFTTPPVLSNPVAFSANTGNCGNYIPYSSSSTGQISMPPGANCYLSVGFTPIAAGAATATLQLTDSAETQSFTLNGSGVVALPAVTLQPETLVFDPQPPGGSSNPYDYSHGVTLTNNGTLPLKISSVAVTAGSADFVVSPYFSNCTGVTLVAGGSCTNVFQFKPSTTGYRTGTATIKDSTGKTYTATLAGYAVPAVDGVSLTTQGLILPATAVQASTSTTGSSPYTVALINQGNRPLTVGKVTGVNVSATGDFSDSAYPAGENCSGATVQPASQCSVSIVFTPRSTGNKMGSVTFPVTYADNKTTSLTATLAGTGLAPANAATLLPQALYFPSQVATTGNNIYGPQLAVTLTNTGNEPLTVGSVTGTNVTTTLGAGGDFVISSSYCYYQPIQPGGTCIMGVNFSPLATGPRTGSITVNVTYAGGAKASYTSSLSGTGVAPAPVLVLTPAGLNFNVAVAGSTDPSNVQNVLLSNPGNAPVKLVSVTTSANFTVTSNSCYGSVAPTFSCQVTVEFTPAAATAAGNVSGTLTVVDNAPGSPHVVKLSGTVVAVANELSLSQASVAFGTQPVGTARAPQVVYLTNLNGSSVLIKSISLGGTNKSDFTESQSCGGSLGFAMAGRSYCTIAVGFSPAKTSVGARTATVTITPASGAAMTVQLTGTGK